MSQTSSVAVAIKRATSYPRLDERGNPSWIWNRFATDKPIVIDTDGPLVCLRRAASPVERGELPAGAPALTGDFALPPYGAVTGETLSLTVDFGSDALATFAAGIILETLQASGWRKARSAAEARAVMPAKQRRAIDAALQDCFGAACNTDAPLLAHTSCVALTAPRDDDPATAPIVAYITAALADGYAPSDDTLDALASAAERCGVDAAAPATLAPVLACAADQLRCPAAPAPTSDRACEALLALLSASPVGVGEQDQDQDQDQA